MAGVLWTRADALRDAVVAALAAGGRAAVPSTFVLAGGNVAYECESLIVHVEDVRTGTPGSVDARPIKGGTPWVVSLAAHLVRDCQPVGDGEVPPTDAEQEVASVQLLDDAATFVPAVLALAAGGCGLAVTSITFPGPQGAMAAAVLRVQVSL